MIGQGKLKISKLLIGCSESSLFVVINRSNNNNHYEWFQKLCTHEFKEIVIVLTAFQFSTTISDFNICSKKFVTTTKVTNNFRVAKT